MLLSTDREAEVHVAALTVDEDGLHALVGLGAVGATLRLLPPVLFKDAGLGVGEEEGVAAVRTGEVRACGLGRLLGVTAVRTTDWLGPAVLGEEELVTTREGEGTGAVRTRELDVLGKSRTLAPRRTVAVATRGLLGVRRGLGSCCIRTLLGRSGLVGHGLLELGDTLVDASEKAADLRSILTNGDAVEGVVAVGASLEESLLSDERHVERLVGRVGGKCAGDSRVLTFNFTVLKKNNA